MEYLEQLVAEWYEYQGYFVRKGLWVGLQSDGSYECLLDVVAFHPVRHHIVQVEPSLDLLSFAEKERHFQPKFDAGRRYLHRMFGADQHSHIEQVALIAAGNIPHHTIGGGKILLQSDFLAQILGHFSGMDGAPEMVPAKWPIMSTLQLVADHRERLCAALKSA